MNRTHLILAFLMTLTLASCKNTLPKRFDSFVSAVEAECSAAVSYSEEYWMDADRRFRKLYDEFQAAKSSFTSDEKRVINSDIARYEYQRIDSFVSYVEGQSSEFSEDDWLSANDRFLELALEYKDNRHAYNSREKRQIDSAIIHYCGLVIRSRIPSVIDKGRSILRELGLSF